MKHLPTAFPIEPLQQQFYYDTSIITRTQFPLFPAYATTSYKCQSRNMKRIIAHLEYITASKTRQPKTYSIRPDHIYVQCSRPSCGIDLMLFPKLPNLQQTRRQQQTTILLESMLHYNFHLPQPDPKINYLLIAYHSGQACAIKLNYYSKDNFYSNLDIFCLAELHSPLQHHSLPNFFKNCVKFQVLGVTEQA